MDVKLWKFGPNVNSSNFDMLEGVGTLDEAYNSLIEPPIYLRADSILIITERKDRLADGRRLLDILFKIHNDERCITIAKHDGEPLIDEIIS